MTLRLISIQFLWLLPLLSSGCYQDMLKATPFARGVGEETAEDRVALWPLFYHRRPVTSFLWPMGEITDDSWAIRPLIAVYGQGTDILWPFVHVGEKTRSSYFAPLVAWKPDPDGFLWTPLLGWRSPQEAAGWFYAPLYTTGWAPDEHWHFVPPLLTTWGHDRGESWFGSPLYVEVDDAKSVDRALPVLLSWWDTSKDGDWSANVLLSFFGITRSSEQSSEHLFPFYWRGKIEREGRPGRSSWWAIVPFYAGFRGPDGSRFDGLPFLLSARTVTASGNPGWHLLLSLVAWGSRSAGRDSQDALFHRALPFYSYDDEPRRTRVGILPPLYGQTVYATGAWSVDYLLYLGRVSKHETREASRFFPLYSWSRKQLKIDDEAENGETPVPAQRVEEVRFELLGYLYDHLGERYDDGDEYRRHRVLWRLYHDEARGDSRSIDIFPFIAYDRIGEESLTWSWLYKFVRYERRGEEKALHLFFLPAIRW